MIVLEILYTVSYHKHLYLKAYGNSCSRCQLGNINAFFWTSNCGLKLTNRGILDWSSIMVKTLIAEEHQLSRWKLWKCIVSNVNNITSFCMFVFINFGFCPLFPYFGSIPSDIISLERYRAPLQSRILAISTSLAGNGTKRDGLFYIYRKLSFTQSRDHYNCNRWNNSQYRWSATKETNDCDLNANKLMFVGEISKTSKSSYTNLYKHSHFLEKVKPNSLVTNKASISSQPPVDDHLDTHWSLFAEPSPGRSSVSPK